MEWLYYTLISLAIFFIILIVISYFQAKHASVKIDADTFKQNMRKAQIIDVRTKSEYQKGHINGARNIEVRLLSREYIKLRKDQPIYLYCASGKRSTQAAIFLRSKGFTDVYELEKGLSSWDGPIK